LIASPNGRSAALILITHKSDFGEHTVIGSVTAWCQEDKNEEPGSEDSGGEQSSWDIHLLFTYKKEYNNDDSSWDDDGDGEDEDWGGSIISFESTATATSKPTLRHRFIM
jgi:hypothetical protein